MFLRKLFVKIALKVKKAFKQNNKIDSSQFTNQATRCEAIISITYVLSCTSFVS